MAPSSKAQYLGYHLSFDCDAGFDVPMAAFERQHHRSRHRSSAKPGTHGGEKLARHHARPRLLARCHSWPGGEDDEQDWPLSEECCEEQCARPPQPPVDVVAATTPPPDFLLQGESGDVDHDVRCRPMSGWAAFAGRFISEARACHDHGGSSTASSGPRQNITGALHVEAADDRVIDAETAKVAARVLPALLEDVGGDLSLGRLKLLLESAVSLAALRSDPISAVAVPLVKRDSVGGGWEEGDVPVEELVCTARDLRGKGWTKSHKGSRNAKKREQVSFRSAQRLAQFYDAIGYFSADEEQLGRSWALHDKARSKQHGGNAMSRRTASDHRGRA